MTDTEIRDLLLAVRTIAVVGLSERPERDSHRVSAYLQRQGYRIIPVNPALKTVLGETCFASLRDVPVKIDLVDVFRRPEFVPGIVEDTIALGTPALWLQDGVVHEEAADRARRAGLKVVMDACTMREHVRLVARR